MKKHRRRGRRVNVETLERLCAELNLRRGDLADVAVLARSTIDKMFDGREVDDRSIERVAKKLGVSEQELITGVAPSKNIAVPQPSANGQPAQEDVPPAPANQQAMSVTVDLKHIGVDAPEDVAHFFKLMEDTMNRYGIYKKYKDMQVDIMYIPGKTADGRNTYVYAMVSALLRDKMKEALSLGIVPDFCVILEMGFGEPPDFVRAMMKRYYGFDHTAAPLLLESPSPEQTEEVGEQESRAELEEFLDAEGRYRHRDESD